MQGGMVGKGIWKYVGNLNKYQLGYIIKIMSNPGVKKEEN